MNRYFSLFVFTVFLGVSWGHTEAPAGGIKAMKSASRNDPATIAVDLTSPEPADRGRAAQTLGRMGSSARTAIDAVLEALTDFASYQDDKGTHVVSVEAAQALHQMDPKSPVPSKILQRIVRAAGAAPERQLVQGGWVSRCGAQAEALATLTALGPLAQSIIPDLTRLNHHPCTEGRAFVAAQAIGPLASDQIPQLLTFLTDPEPEARRSVADYIGEARVTGATAALGRAMNDSSSAVRLAAVEALEKLHPEGEGRVPLMKPFLQDSQPEIRRQALRLLLKLAPDAPQTLTLLKEQLKDSDNSIVMESAQAIARIQPRNREMMDALIRLASVVDTDSGVQAAELLKSSGSRDPKVVTALEPYRERERQRQIEKTLLTSTPEERSANARTLRVNAIRVSKGIKEEQPDRAGRVFTTADKRLYCWTATSAVNAPTSLRHVWYLDGKPVYETILVVPELSKHVWSSRPIKPGKWRVEVTMPNTSIPLAAASFTVTKN